MGGAVEAWATQVDLLKAGDPVAQGKFWREHWDRIYPLCARILGSGPDANEVAVDVLTDFLFVQVQRLDHPQAGPSYLRLMAVRRAIRRRDRRAELCNEAASPATDSPNARIDDALDLRKLLPKLQECLGELSPKAQQAIRLRFAGEWTNERIGGVVGGSKQYIGRLLRASLGLLRQCIERPPRTSRRSAGRREGNTRGELQSHAD